MIVVGNLPLAGLSADDVSMSMRPVYSPTAMDSQLPGQAPPRIMTAPAPQPGVPAPGVPAPYPDLMTDLPVDPYVDYEPYVPDLPVVADTSRKCKWWCWVLIAGGVATVGGLAYYIAKK